MPRPRAETKVRACALQLLYAWDIRGMPPLDVITDPMFRGWRTRHARGGERLARRVADDSDRLDEAIGAAIEGWRWERVGVVERNILRLGAAELLDGETPPRVVIDEAVRLAQWFAGVKAPSFVNGVLDAVARRMHRL